MSRLRLTLYGETGRNDDEYSAPTADYQKLVAEYAFMKKDPAHGTWDRCADIDKCHSWEMEEGDAMLTPPLATRPNGADYPKPTNMAKSQSRRQQTTKKEL
jgi:hypothetical protein